MSRNFLQHLEATFSIFACATIASTIAIIQALEFLTRIYKSNSMADAEEIICHARQDITEPGSRRRGIPMKLLMLLNADYMGLEGQKAWTRWSLLFLKKSASSKQLVTDVTAWHIVERRKEAMFRACQLYKKDSQKYPEFKTALLALTKVRTIPFGVSYQ